MNRNSKAFHRKDREGRSLRTSNYYRFAAIVCILFFGFHVYAQVTSERLVSSGKEPQNWLMYSGDYSGKRHSSLDQINASNAKTIVAKWVYQTGATGKFETTPLVAAALSGCISARFHPISVRVAAVSIAG
jgi:hypothetical protein